METTAVIAWATEHWWLAFWLAFWAIAFGAMVAMSVGHVVIMLVNRPLRTIKVLARGWPPAHLDADGDWKPAPEKAQPAADGETVITLDALKDMLVVPLEKHELTSGLDRLRLAGSLIKQLPPTHEGRNSWLWLYTKTNNVASNEWRIARGLGPYPMHNVDVS